MKKSNIFYSKFIFVLCLFVVLLSGCRGDADSNDYDYQGNFGNEIIDLGDFVQELRLSDGQLLAVRLVYAIDDDAPEDEWYKVSLINKINGWSNYVRMDGIGRSEVRHHDDYFFTKENFNFQHTQDIYKDNVDGIYALIIEGSTGYEKEYHLDWQGNRWLNIDGTLVFRVP